jgi:8-oxo-dGTP pyrophosphatase MutT (NUDIX family)
VCAPCVAHLSTPAQRVSAIREVIADEPEPLVSLTHLLRLCRDEHSLLWERLGDPATDTQIAARMGPLAALTSSAPTATILDRPTRRILADALAPGGDLPPVVLAHALADWLDTNYGHTFTASFHDRSPYQPAVGDPLPVDVPDLRQVTAMAPTAPPWRLANRLDQTRRVRLAGEWATQFRVVFDYSLTGVLSGLISADTVIATCHPNRYLAEIRMPLDERQLSFPIGPVDVDRQSEQINRLIADATRAGASIILLPELCVTEALAADLQQWIRRADGPRLLVTGSYHRQDETTSHATGRLVVLPSSPPRSAPPRHNTALSWVRGHDQPLTHDKYSPADHPVREDIQPAGWPELRVYVTGDGWHLAVVICRDLLNPHAVHALTEAGVNLLLVPAMSETLMPFGGPAAQLVGCTQALVAVANNPADWATIDQPAAHRPAHALFGHPGFGQQTLLVPADPEPGIALLHVRSGRLTWLPAESDSPKPAAGAARGQMTAIAPPAWAATLGEITSPPESRRVPLLTLRTAAVLVLIRDTATGPRVLLTRRTSDLADYPSQLVFPGGATDSGDTGPIATALREAAEETGLDPASVHIIGCLPPRALLDSGFLVTPVLAWTSNPDFSGPVNLAEVDTMTEVPVHGPDTEPQPAAINERSAAEAGGLGTMTAAVLAHLRAALRTYDVTPSTGIPATFNGTQT